MTSVRREQPDQQAGQQIPAGGMPDPGKLRNAGVKINNGSPTDQSISELMQRGNRMSVGEVIQ